jgi:hypothetical protein
MCIFNRVHAVHKQVTEFGAEGRWGWPDIGGKGKDFAWFHPEGPVYALFLPCALELCISRGHRVWRGFSRYESVNVGCKLAPYRHGVNVTTFLQRESLDKPTNHVTVREKSNFVARLE